MSEESATFFTENREYLNLFRQWTRLHVRTTRWFIFTLSLLNLLLLTLFFFYDGYVATYIDTRDYTEQPIANQSHGLNMTLLSKDHLVVNQSKDQKRSTTLTCLTKSYGYRAKMFDNACFRWTCIACILIVIFILILYNIALWVAWLFEKYHKISNGKSNKWKRNQFIDWISFNIISSTYVTLLFTKVIFDLMIYHGYNGKSTTSQDLLFYVVLMFGIATVLPYSVFYDSIGYYYIMIQGLAKRTAHFILLYTLVVIPFVASSERIIMRNLPANCPFDFAPGIDTAYSLLLVLMNSLNMADALGKDVDIDTLRAIKLLHIIFIFISVIVLINFLIALFSTTANEIINTKDIHLLIGRLYVSS